MRPSIMSRKQNPGYVYFLALLRSIVKQDTWKFCQKHGLGQLGLLAGSYRLHRVDQRPMPDGGIKSRATSSPFNISLSVTRVDVVW